MALSMAVSPINLSISMISLLFAQRPSSPAGRSVPRHVHPHWQFEWLLRGEATAEVGDQVHTLTPGSGLLIPPTIEHGFIYRRGGTAWVSIKFTSSESDIIRSDDDGELPAHPASQALAQAIAACVDDAGRIDEAAAPALQALLTLRQRPVVHHGDGLSAAIERIIVANPLHPWRVDSLAAALTLTPGHCSTRFRHETGTTLKAHLDRCRADACLHLLRFADADIAVIAEQAGFPDVFTFSRFIRRVSGKPPSAWRE
jgi:AraC family transcriptional regulator